jgi:hypothetical protein
MWSSSLFKSLGTGFEVLQITVCHDPTKWDLKIGILNPAIAGCPSLATGERYD